MRPWLQKRLEELELTHDDLANRLEKLDIRRVRATITGWANGKRISLLSNPKQAKRLAKALDWTLEELLLAAGYDIGRVNTEIPPPFVKYIQRYERLTKAQQQEFINSLDFIMRLVRQVPDGGVPPDSEPPISEHPS